MKKYLITEWNNWADCRMVYEVRRQSMAWIETDCSNETHFRWKIKWRLEHLGALGIMGETFLCSDLVFLAASREIKDKFIKRFPSFCALKKFATTAPDPELLGKIKVRYSKTWVLGPFYICLIYFLTGSKHSVSCSQMTSSCKCPIFFFFSFQYFCQETGYSSVAV